MTQKLITRSEIQEIVDCSRSKMRKFIINKDYEFPNFEKIGDHKAEYFDEAKVIDWLNNNSVHHKKIKTEFSQKMPVLDNRLAQKFLFGRL